MPFKPEVFVENKWSQNALVFETKAEAEANARDLMMRWFAVADSRAVWSDMPVTHTYTGGELKEVKHGDA